MLDWFKGRKTDPHPSPADDATVVSFDSQKALGQHDDEHPRQVGAYHIVKLLGEGGMARVYVAQAPDGRQVALKMLFGVDAEDLVNRARFEREIEIGRKLHHDNVCPMIDAGVTDDGSFYLVMELLHGETLLQEVDRLAPMPVGLTRPILEQILTGLAAIHDIGVVHRDLKPANVFITDSRGVKIMDFGIAHGSGMNRVTRTGNIFGTLQFMSPEQVKDSKHVDHRTDLFNVGLIAYQMLTRRLPLEGTTDKVLPRLVRGELTPITEYRQDLPPAILPWLDKLLAGDPAARWQTAAEALSQLRF